MTTTLDRTFTTRQAPWTRVGTVIDDPDVNAAEAARLGGLDFDVELRRSAFEGDDADTWLNVGSRRAVIRRDTGHFFSFVSPTYRPVQYRDAFAFMDGINPRYVAAGAFSGGRQAFMVVQLPGFESFDPLPDRSDPHDFYVVLRTSHDLSKAIEVAALPLRGRCMNQLPLPSFARDAPQRWSVRHVGDPLKRLQVARDTLGRATRYAEVFQGMVRQLASVRIDVEDARRVLRRVLPDKPKRPEQLAAVERALTSSAEVGYPGTGWGLVNAVSEYFEHGRDSGSRTPQARFTGGLAGDTRKYVSRTAQLLLAR